MNLIFSDIGRPNGLISIITIYCILFISMTEIWNQAFSKIRTCNIIMHMEEYTRQTKKSCIASSTSEFLWNEVPATSPRPRRAQAENLKEYIVVII